MNNTCLVFKILNVIISSWITCRSKYLFCDIIKHDNFDDVKIPVTPTVELSKVLRMGEMAPNRFERNSFARSDSNFENPCATYALSDIQRVGSRQTDCSFSFRLMKCVNIVLTFTIEHSTHKPVSIHFSNVYVHEYRNFIQFCKYLKLF